MDKKTKATLQNTFILLKKAKSASFGKGASEQEIDAAEKILGCTIRGDYRQFLSTFGWGGASHFEIYGVGSDVPPYLDLVRTTRSERTEMTPRLPEYLLPLMNDGGGNHYCLDLAS